MEEGLTNFEFGGNIGNEQCGKGLAFCCRKSKAAKVSLPM